MSIPRIASYPMPGLDDVPEARVDWQPDPARAVLLIHDMQEYFLDFFDANRAPVPELLASIGALRDACDAAGVPVVYTAQPGRQTPAQRGLLQAWWGPGITAQPARAAIAAPIAPRVHDTVLDKWRYSAFVSSDLRERMHALGRDQLVVCGVYAHIGCQATVLDAFMHDIQAFLVADALADFSAREHLQALEFTARRCGVVLTREHCVEALAADGALPASLQGLRTELAQIMEIPVDGLDANDNPLESGLDSIRLMSLVERWTGRGARLGFVELAQCRNVEEWWQLIQSRRTAA